jgi:hypothetical protein
MEMSQSIGALAKALSLAQKEFPAIVKNRVVSVRGKAQYEFKYAELDQIIEKTRPVLSAHGLVVTQLVGIGKLTTVLAHESGEWISEEAELPSGAYNQEVGAGITYRRRYALAALLNISAEDDDDGGQEEESEKRVSKSWPKLTEEQLGEIMALVPTDRIRDQVCTAYDVRRLSDLPSNVFDEVKSRLLSRGRVAKGRKGADDLQGG